MCTRRHYTAVEFLPFLEKVVANYKGERIVMILDNARIHHAKLIQPFLEQHKAFLTLMYFPPYNPNLNMIEELWGWLKSAVINNVFFDSV
ncbi:transposase [Sporosarcina limicola]|uniref:Transposase n=1 Tax=Sporosarcina limicola TaxID=34101 RepID=A0A927R2F1_9BACL|nr:transposase [Sporosarcina limicola]MBE1553861.1 transposase [Sporosarcina limicola]